MQYSSGQEEHMRQRKRWQRGLRLGKGEVLALHNARRRAQEAGETKFDQHLRGILLVGHDHYTQDSAAEILEVDTNSITRWVMAYQKGGIEALRPKKASGRPPRLTPEMKARLAKWIDLGPEEFGLDRSEERRV